MSNDYKGLCSHQYDKEFNKHNFKWLPWVGKNYNEHRILILGASHHAIWDKEKLKSMPPGGKESDEYISKIRDSIDEDKNFHRDITYHHGITKTECCKRWLWWHFSDAMLASYRCNETEREKLWSSLAFANAIQETMTKNTATITSKGRGKEAWEKFQELVKIIKPKIVICWGSAVINHWGWKNYVNVRWDETISGVSPKHADMEIDGHKLRFLAVRHPSHGFSSEKWGEYLMSKFPKEIGALRK